MPFSPSRRLWIFGDCPPQLTDACPPEYAVAGTCILSYGGTSTGDPPVSWAQNLGAQIGLSETATATICLRNAEAFLWTAYYDPTGQVTPVSFLPPPEPDPE